MVAGVRVAAVKTMTTAVSAVHPTGMPGECLSLLMCCHSTAELRFTSSLVHCLFLTWSSIASLQCIAVGTTRLCQ